MLRKKLGLEAIERDWREYASDYFKIPSSLIIPKGCERIGNCTFEECKRLEKVVISESVEEIGYYAFCGCRSLREVIIPESVEEIECCAFSGCKSAEITIKKAKDDFGIGTLAFFECKSVEYAKKETRY